MSEWWASVLQAPVPWMALVISLIAVTFTGSTYIVAMKDRRANAALQKTVHLDLVFTSERVEPMWNPAPGQPFTYQRRHIWTLHNSGRADVWDPQVKMKDDESIAFVARGCAPGGGELRMMPVGKELSIESISFAGYPAVARWVDRDGKAHVQDIVVTTRAS
jgi:hypothetical protein